MGRRALTSHAVSKKHRLAANGARTPSVASFLTPPASEPSGAVVTKAGPVASGSAPPSSSTTATDIQPECAAKDIFQRDTEVINAEVMWCLNAVMTHTSFRTAAASASLFPLMFPSSATAKKVQLGKDMVGYTIVYGLAPFFRESLVSELNQASYLVLAFDESLNKVAQKEQMDVLVRFWSDAEGSVKTRYLTSCFLGRTRAQDFLSAFKSATDGLSRSKILQISMDGPNVNMKFLREIKQELCESNDGRHILDVGSCGLHVVNGAFKTGHAATDLAALNHLSDVLVQARPPNMGRGHHFGLLHAWVTGMQQLQDPGPETVGLPPWNPTVERQWARLEKNVAGSLRYIDASSRASKCAHPWLEQGLELGQEARDLFHRMQAGFLVLRQTHAHCMNAVSAR
ncbi:uncharacterized protein [Dermacentor andersoni]|uniref:uncharacterized protein n=1 Tax=Dermacentor andersoni TaxID=34620 RepID=UPI002417E81F|nr:uncharacterized protein LOC126528276 [Dermacentor andersoni]